MDAADAPQQVTEPILGLLSQVGFENAGLVAEERLKDGKDLFLGETVVEGHENLTHQQLHFTDGE